MIYGYIRVSSDKQTVENQRFEINNFCLKENMHIDGWIEETISGTKNYDKRELGRLLKKVQKVWSWEGPKGGRPHPKSTNCTERKCLLMSCSNRMYRNGK